GAHQAMPGDRLRRMAGDVPAAKGDAPRVWLEKAGDEREERRLARPIRADQRNDAALGHFQGNIMSGPDAAEALGNLTHFKHWRQPPAPCPRRPGAWRAGARTTRRAHAA